MLTGKASVHEHSGVTRNILYINPSILNLGKSKKVKDITGKPEQAFFTKEGEPFRCLEADWRLYIDEDK